MVTATPEVKPTVMVAGMNFISEPARQIPRIISMIPAMTVAMTSPSKPFAAITPATIVANAAVGPEMLTLLPPRNAMTSPAIAAV